jgi:hypothetical protein
LVLLAVLGGLGIFPFFGAMESAVYYDATPLIVGCIVILFLTLLSTVIMFWRTRHNPSARSFGRVVLGTFALAGVCVLLCFALVLFMFVVCLANPHAFF